MNILWESQNLYQISMGFKHPQEKPTKLTKLTKILQTFEVSGENPKELQ